MATVLKAVDRGPSFGERLNASIGRGLDTGKQLMQEYAQNKAEESFEKKYGVQLRGLAPEQKKLVVESVLDKQSKEFGNQFEIDKLKKQQDFQREQDEAKRKFEEEQQNRKYSLESDLEETKAYVKNKKDIKENLEPLNAAKDALNQMRKIRKKGNLGRLSSAQSFFGGETAKDKGEYETLGNSLIQYATNIPIRNRIEFEKLAGHISDPNITDSEAEGILNAMERIITNSMNQYSEESGNKAKQNTPSQERPPLSSFHR